MKKMIALIVLTCMLLTTPVHSSDFVVYDLGDGSYIAGSTGMEEWILWLYAKIQMYEDCGIAATIMYRSNS